MGGKVQLPLLEKAPHPLYDLLHLGDAKSKHFIENIRAYNMMFCFTSMGGRIDSSVNEGPGPYSYVLNGQNHHLIGSLLPTSGSSPKFAQLYIYDTDNEVANKISAIMYVKY